MHTCSLLNDQPTTEELNLTLASQPADSDHQQLGTHTRTKSILCLYEPNHGCMSLQSRVNIESPTN